MDSVTKLQRRLHFAAFICFGQASLFAAVFYSPATKNMNWKRLFDAAMKLNMFDFPARVQRFGSEKMPSPDGWASLRGCVYLAAVCIGQFSFVYKDVSLNALRYGIESFNASSFRRFSRPPEPAFCLSTFVSKHLTCIPAWSAPARTTVACRASSGHAKVSGTAQTREQILNFYQHR